MDAIYVLKQEISQTFEDYFTQIRLNGEVIQQIPREQKSVEMRGKRNQTQQEDNLVSPGKLVWKPPDLSAEPSLKEFHVEEEDLFERSKLGQTTSRFCNWKSEIEAQKVEAPMSKNEVHIQPSESSDPSLSFLADEVKKLNPEANPKEMSNLLGAKWKADTVEEKNPYEETYKTENEVYLKVDGHEKTNIRIEQDESNGAVENKTKVENESRQEGGKSAVDVKISPRKHNLEPTNNSGITLIKGDMGTQGVVGVENSVFDPGRDKGKLKLQKECGKIVGKLIKHKHGYVFRVTVDVVALGLHDYHIIVNRPMDLGTVKANLAKTLYSSPFKFAADVRLTFNNAMLYNPKHDPVHGMAEQMLARFKELFKPIQEKVDCYMGQQKDEFCDYGDNEDLQFQDIKEIHCSSWNNHSNKVLGSPIKTKKVKSKPSHMHVEQVFKKLDIETLDTETLWELDHFVTNWKKMVSKTKRQALMMNYNSDVGFAPPDIDLDVGAMSDKMTGDDKKLKDNDDEDVDIDDDVSKNQYHSYKCEMYGMDGKENFFQCDQCEDCYSKLLRDSHICVERAMHHNCPVCFEYLFNTKGDIIVFPSGHIHLDCVKQMIEQHFQYACPVCLKSYCDMTHIWELLDQEVVPYEDPNDPHYIKDGFDASENGLGKNAHSLKKECLLNYDLGKDELKENMKVEEEGYNSETAHDQVTFEKLKDTEKKIFNIHQKVRVEILGKQCPQVPDSEIWGVARKAISKENEVHIVQTNAEIHIVVVVEGNNLWLMLAPLLEVDTVEVIIQTPTFVEQHENKCYFDSMKLFNIYLDGVEQLDSEMMNENEHCFTVPNLVVINKGEIEDYKRILHIFDPRGSRQFLLIMNYMFTYPHAVIMELSWGVKKLSTSKLSLDEGGYGVGSKFRCFVLSCILEPLIHFSVEGVYLILGSVDVEGTLNIVDLKSCNGNTISERVFRRASLVLRIQTNEKVCSGASMFFYLAREGRKEEEMMGLEGLLGKNDVNRERFSLERKLSTPYKSKSIDVFTLYVYVLILEEENNEIQAMTVLVMFVSDYFGKWNAWYELQTLCIKTLALSSFHLHVHGMKDFFFAKAYYELWLHKESLTKYEYLQGTFSCGNHIQSQIAKAQYNPRESEQVKDIFEELLRNDPYQIEDMDVNTFVLYAKECFSTLSYLAYGVFLTVKYGPESYSIIGNYYSLKGHYDSFVKYFRRDLRMNKKCLSSWILRSQECLEKKNNSSTMTKQYIQSIISVDQRVALVLFLSCLGSLVGLFILPGTRTDAHLLELSEQFLFTTYGAVRLNNCMNEQHPVVERVARVKTKNIETKDEGSWLSSYFTNPDPWGQGS